MKARQEEGKENNLENSIEKPGEKYISVRRIAYLILIALFTIAAVFALSFIKGVLPDTAILTSILSMMFLLIFFLELRTYRLSGRLSYESTSYRNIFISIVFSLAIIFAGAFLPEYFFPAAIVAIILTAFMDMRLSLPAGIFLIIIFSVILGSSIYVVSNAIIIFLAAALLTDNRKENGFSYLSLITLFLIQFILPQIFYYFSHASYEKENLLIGALEAAADCIIYYFVFPHFQKSVSEEEKNTFDSILDNDYSLVQDMKHYSMREYEHARRVEKAARESAKLIGLDENTIAAAGFYYRLGKIYGEPERENAVKAAVNHCFPNDVTAIISKYGLKDSIPETKEEAVVDISNEVVTRLEILDSEKKDTFSSGWNQSMVIIQLLNELSAKGYYDESTLSINQFLRIRDYLAECDLMNIE